MERKKYIICLLVIACIMTIGFAVLSTTLTLSSTTTVKANTWNLKFQNIVVDTNNTVTATTAPSITDNTSINFAVALNEPGDMFAFSVDVVNTGSIDAMVNSITKSNLTSEQRKLICFEVIYNDGTDIIQYDKLANTTGTDKILVLVIYKTNVESSDLPSSEINLNLGFSINYVQADSNAKLKDDQYIYSSSEEVQKIGQALPSITTYTSPADAITAFGGPVFIKHKMVNNIIEVSYMSMKIDGEFYYFKIEDTDDNFFKQKYIVNSIFNEEDYSYNLFYDDDGDITVAYEPNEYPGLGIELYLADGITVNYFTDSKVYVGATNYDFGITSCYYIIP